MAVAVSAVALVLAGCATPEANTAANPATAPSPRAGTSAPADPLQQYTAQATLIQQLGEEPQLCLGGVAQSLPPQCGGPTIIGLDWDDVADAETASGVTWGGGWVVGTFDRESDTFTLTAPVAAEPPAGFTLPEHEPLSFEPLCDDPYRGGDVDAYPIDTSFPEGPALGPEGAEAMSTVQEVGYALPGYVEMFVSDGFSQLNVLVADEAEVNGAHAALREVWQGWLCVGARNVPTQEDAQAASEALSAQAMDLGLLDYGPNTLQGTFHIGLILADPETTERISEILAPWYASEAIEFDSRLMPLEG